MKDQKYQYLFEVSSKSKEQRIKLKYPQNLEQILTIERENLSRIKWNSQVGGSSTFVTISALLSADFISFDLNC